MENFKKIILIESFATILSLSMMMPAVTVSAKNEYPERVIVCTCGGTDKDMGIAYVIDVNSMTCNYALYNGSSGAYEEYRILRRNKFEEPAAGSFYHYDQTKNLYVQCVTAKPAKVKKTLRDVFDKIYTKLESMVMSLVFRISIILGLW